MELKDISPEDYDIEVALGKAKLPEDSIDLWFDTSDAVLIMTNLETVANFLGATDLTRKYVCEYVGTIAPFAVALVFCYYF